MNRMKSLVLILVTACWMAGALAAADVKVIANNSVGASAVSREELKGVFLETKNSLSDGSAVEPVLLKSGPAHETFLKEVVGKMDAALQNYYRSLVFTGKGSMPKVIAGEAEVVAYVAKTKGAIGYVSTGAAVAGVKILELK